MGLTKEQTALLREARAVWTDLEEAKKLKTPWQEETITDILIRNLRRAYPGTIDVIAFNKPLEGESGADWIWSFVDTGGTASATMLVQAKRLHDNERRYCGVNRNIGKRTPPSAKSINSSILRRRTASRHFMHFIIISATPPVSRPAANPWHKPTPIEHSPSGSASRTLAP